MSWTPPPGYPPAPPGYPPTPPGYPPAGAPKPKPITGSPQTMAMHAMSIDPRTGLPRGEKPPASIAAVLSLVCGILLCLGPLTAVPAIIAGLLARKAVRDDPVGVGGSNMAVLGIALGAVNLVASAILVTILILTALSD
jgi:hypothetical protein